MNLNATIMVSAPLFLEGNTQTYPVATHLNMSIYLSLLWDAGDIGPMVSALMI